MRLADLVVKQLETWGVQFVFGVAGDANLHLLDSLSRSNIRFIAARHEACAGFMASAYAKLTGHLGVCVATSGPGSANLVNGLGDAFMDRVPVLAITGQVPSRFVGQRHKQAINQQALLDPVSVFSTLAADPSAVPGIVGRAVRLAIARGGPAHVSVPYDFWESDLAAEIIPYQPFAGKPICLPDADALSETAAMIAASTRPFILAGRGARKSGAALQKLAEQIGVAVAYTLPANGVIYSDHYLTVGGIGAAGSNAASRLINRADLIIRIGATWWPEGFVLANPNAVLDITLSGEELAPTGRKYAALIGDAHDIIPAVSGLLANFRCNDSWINEIAAEKQAWLEHINQERSVPGGRCVHPADIIRALQALSPDTIITLDSGDQTLWFNRHFVSRGQQVVVPGHWRSLGFAVPAAMAVKLAAPARPVVALIGDAGLDMCLAEIPAAVQNGSAITIVVANNRTMAIERNRMIKEGLTPHGVDRLAPSYASFAELCGGKGFYVSDPVKLEDTIKEAVKSENLTVVEIETAAVMIETTKL